MKLCRQKKNPLMSPEEKADKRDKERVRVQLYREKKNPLMSPKEKADKRDKDRVRKQLNREKKNASMSLEEQEDKRDKERVRVQLYREKKRASQEAKDNKEENIQEKTCDYNIPVDIKSPIRQARERDQKEIMKVDNDPNACRVAVCVLCDRLIIGCESIHKITGEKLRSQSQRISVKSYEDYHQVKLKDELVSQYQITGYDLEGLLLSPRAKKTCNRNGSVAFE
ncbi:hypothetical protein ACHAWC_001031, partial [Mediolabrus comicus]